MSAPAQQLPVMLLTDFGVGGEFAGVCHAVICKRAPGAQVIHVTHGIPPYAVLEGALVLRSVLPYLPQGVVMAIVDPGVGTDRRCLALRTREGSILVGPDNGLLLPAAEANGGIGEGVSIEAPEFQLQPLSSTFHARDIFAPAAAHLAAGGVLADLGPTVDPASLKTIEIPAPCETSHGLEVVVWSIDRFGNAALQLRDPQFSELVSRSNQVEVVINRNPYFAQVARTFASVPSGELLLYLDSYGYATIAVNQGNAAQMFSMSPGDSITVRAMPEST